MEFTKKVAKAWKTVFIFGFLVSAVDALTGPLADWILSLEYWPSNWPDIIASVIAFFAIIIIVALISFLGAFLIDVFRMVFCKKPVNPTVIKEKIPEQKKKIIVNRKLNKYEVIIRDYLKGSAINGGNKPKINWRNVRFIEWNKRFSYNEVRGGIIIDNHKNDVIKNCEVKIIEIYAEDGIAYYKDTQSGLSVTAGWETDDIVSYQKTDIGKKDDLRIVLTYCEEDGVFQSFYVGGKNFSHPFMGVETCFVKIKIFGKINEVQLNPLIKYITVRFDGKKFTIKDIVNDLAKI